MSILFVSNDYGDCCLKPTAAKIPWQNEKSDVPHDHCVPHCFTGPALLVSAAFPSQRIIE
jgi:hypothetical protein